MKNHPYFDGIDWDKVAEGKTQRPYEAHPIAINYDKTLDLAEELDGDRDEELDANDELDASVLMRLQSKFHH